MPFTCKNLYGLIGKPLGHSFSADFFNRKFESEGIDARYLNFEIDSVAELPRLLVEYPALSGLNVTSPYKRAVIPYLDSVDPTAKEVGAVNVIKIVRMPDGTPRMEGYNSDVPGFADSLKGMAPGCKNALILGTGGAATACRAGFDRLGIRSVLVSRTPGPERITYGDITPEIMSSHLIVVNATPLGMYPHVGEAPELPYDLLTERHLAYDLVYNPDVTEFMRRAAANGAETKNGLEMLLLQAFESWRIFKAR
ncbi:MAG: shikimate dehydrogenase [Muribaculaceae bacterium]|nr:shikimate dehydrogenase [Muribaculaceae bacterium]MDE6332227.1 shikimate dehydrogenase [Muribaculaceae bacterium]